MINGKQMIQIAERIFPICRSITGNGVRETFKILMEYLTEIKIFEVPSGTKVFDWTIPKEWNIYEAYIEDEEEKIIIDFKENNLHVMGYSMPINEYLSLTELKKIIFTEKNQKEVIPYVTSYYKERVGFCMSEKELQKLSDKKYHAVISSELKEGSLTYGEIIIKGKSEKEILLSTYICHPSMANNECSGPALTVALLDWIKKIPNRQYTYRILFIPETIGSITYLSRNYIEMKEKTIAGFNLSCVGDNRTYSYIESRYGNTLSDQVLKHVLKYHSDNVKKYSYLFRGSDERQYNAPGIDLPVCGFSRSKFGEYPEYHTSADNMSILSAEGFEGSFDVMMKCILTIENNEKYHINVLGEPQLGKRGLYPTISRKGSYDKIQRMMNFIAYADGKNTLLEIAERIDEPAYELISIVEELGESGLLDYEK